ncbi:hypothetical protein KIK06_27815 [Nocardiopsis sp. EMB25]|uniref:hypothetical protein n=1 Tax=Nocardiopsis sp. EMB25 TaxID=2835867 RepID=UPI00228476B5|nr:hypothetical protein [Nocardiopsis sp. EMB25]MCY9787690.1 hypothetical protein [Nocardiopsis sp. EMB25]
MNTLLTSAAVLAEEVQMDRNLVTPGVLGFLMVFAVGVGLYFLMRNMTGKLRTLSADADEADGSGTPVAGASGEGAEAARD